MRIRSLVATLVACAAILPGALAAWPDAAGAPVSGDYHIVLLAEPPLASYRGGTAGLAPTSPLATGDVHLDAESPASLAYLDHLDAAQRAALASIEAAVGHPVDVLDHYRYALNGFSVWLTPTEADRVASLPGVDHVERRTVDRLATDVGPAWSGSTGVWDGSAMGLPEGTRGEGVIIGIVDTGINIDHPSFAAVDGFGYEHANPRGTGNYLGWCNPSHPSYDAKWACNDKLIGLWSHQTSSNNPEDENGHGSHTASTAGGNRIAEAVLVGPTISITRSISGVAPHANIVAYDACPGAGCPSTATTAAIEQAVADGVHVINYSIQVGQDSPWQNSRARAFLAAREAGIIVAVAAGNSGPGPSTNWSNAPWVTTVGNNSHNRTMRNKLVDFDGGDSTPPVEILGKGFTAGLTGPHPVVHAKGYINANGEEDDGRCLVAFPPGTFDSEIVLCDRGVNARVEKGQFVRDGGAAGYILANSEAEGSSLVGDAHFLPAVHISYEDGVRLKAWLATGGDHSARISGVIVEEAEANGDVMSASSSRGPNVGTLCCRRPGLDIPYQGILNVLKPDVSAPGTDVLAAVATGENVPSPEFDLLSGTSMASPHTAGASALVRAVHADWTPAEVQSALMTTSRFRSMRKEDGGTPAIPFDRGAGHIDVSAAVRAGFVLDETGPRYRAANPADGGDPATLNIPSFQDAACLVRCTWERTLESAHDAPVTWTTSAAPGGTLDVTVEPASFTLQPGGTQTIRVTAEAGEPGRWAFADVLFEPSTDDVSEAHMPVAVRPTAARLPAAVVIETDQEAGTHTATGFEAIEITGMTRDVSGLVKATLHTASLQPDTSPGNPWNDPANTLIVTQTVGADVKRLVGEVVSSTAQDVDLYIIRDNGNGQVNNGARVCTSGGEGWHELCELIDPPPGTYWIVAHEFTSNGNPPDEVRLATAIVPAGPAGNLTVAGPSAVPERTPFGLDFTWDLPGTVPGDRWYGAVALGPQANFPGLLGTVPVDIIVVEPGAVKTPTPTTVRPSPTPTATTPATAVPPEPEIFLPLLVRDHEGLGTP